MPRWGPDIVENSGHPTNQVGTIAPDTVACPGKLDRRLVPIFAGVAWFITALSWARPWSQVNVVPIDRKPIPIRWGTPPPPEPT